MEGRKFKANAKDDRRLSRRPWLRICGESGDALLYIEQRRKERWKRCGKDLPLTPVKLTAVSSWLTQPLANFLNG